MRSPAENAELALLLEVNGTPKPGNVDRDREYPDLRFEHFLAGAVGARDGFARAAAGEPLGTAFETAVAGMADQRGGNTQFGAILLLTPLVATAASGPLTPERASERVGATTVADAAGFYRAFDHVDVAVDEPPAGDESGPPDVRRGADAIPDLEERELTLADVMAASAPGDDVAAEWTNGFPRTFRVADRLAAGDGPMTDRAAAAYLAELAAAPDTFVETVHDAETAAEIQRRARELLEEDGEVVDGDDDLEAFAEELVDRGINPGTTADLIAGGLFVALEGGLEV